MNSSSETNSIFDGEDTIPGVIWIITSVGALNWGLVEWANLNLVDELALAAGEPVIGTVVYALVAAAGTITLLDHLGLYDVTDVVDSLIGDGDDSRGQLDLGVAAGRSSQAKNLLAVVGLGIAGGLVFVGIVATGAAAVDSPELANESVQVTNSTDTVYIDVENTTNGPLNVTFIGYNASDGVYSVDRETQVDSPNGMTRVDWTVEYPDRDRYYVVLHEDASSAVTQSVGDFSVGSTNINGASVFGGENGQRNGVILLVVLVAIGLVGRDD